jgi:hypothetical protein
MILPAMMAMTTTISAQRMTRPSQYRVHADSLL